MKIALAGDVMIGRMFNELESTDKIWSSSLLKIINSTNLFSFNLETTITDSNKKWPNKEFNYKISPELAKKILSPFKIPIFANIANNHILDYQEEGLINTISFLKKNNIYFTGAGKSLYFANKPVYIKINDKIICFISAADHYTYWAATKNSSGINLINPKIKKTWNKVINQIKICRPFCYRIIFSCHIGPNYQNTIDLNIKQFAKSIIDAGADIFQGHSAHHILPIEKYNGGLIFYSLGDFIDDYAIDSYYKNDIGMLAVVNLKNMKLIKYKTKIKNLSVSLL